MMKSMDSYIHIVPIHPNAASTLHLTESVCCVSLFLKYINNSATRVDKYNKYVRDIYMFIQIDIESVNSQQKMSKIEHYFHSTICPP